MSVDASAVARVVGVETRYEDLRGATVLYLPQRIVVLAQGNSTETYSLVKRQFTSAAAAGAVGGYGSPMHLVYRELLPVNGDGVGTIPVIWYPLEDGYDAVAASGSITPSGTQTKAASYRVRVAGILSNAFVIAANATQNAKVDAMVAAVNGVLHMPIIASDGGTVFNWVAKWAGPTGNDIVVEVIGDDLGTVFTIVAANGGLIDPDITDALAQMGDVWETLVLNQPGLDDTILDELQTFGEGRWINYVRKPLIVFSGNNDVAVGTATAVSTTRTDDRINSQLVAPGSVNLPFVIAARQLARIAKLANNDPPHDYGSQRATGLIPGTDGEQWNYLDRDQAVKAGSSTIEIKDSVVNISDVVTFYRPEGEEPPAFRHVVDIVKIQQIIFNLRLLFDNAEWDGAPFVPDDQPIAHESAKKPKMVKAEVAALADNLGLQAIISDPEFMKANTTVAIDSMNPKRWNLRTKAKLSGNSNIADIDLAFGFHFGS